LLNVIVFSVIYCNFVSNFLWILYTIKFNKATDFHIFEPLFKQFKVKILTHETLQEKDDSLMTKEEFFSMIDQARKAPTKKMTKEERKKFLGV